MRPVTTSGTSWVVFKNIITASAKIAQKAPCSRYLYLASVHFLTSMMVRLLTNIAPTPSHKAMIKIFLLNANAQITPSKEKLASNTSRYKNKESQTRATFFIVSVGLFKSPVSHSISTKIMIHHTPAVKNHIISPAGKNLDTKRRVKSATTISTDASCQIFLRNFSTGQIR